MPRVHVSNVAISLDGYSAGPDQSMENPLGVGGLDLMDWFFHTRTFNDQHGGEGGEAGVDDDFAHKSMTGNGAWILGRNMFGPIRGPWPNDEWKGLNCEPHSSQSAEPTDRPSRVRRAIWNIGR